MFQDLSEDACFRLDRSFRCTEGIELGKHGRDFILHVLQIQVPLPAVLRVLCCAGRWLQPRAFCQPAVRSALVAVRAVCCFLIPSALSVFYFWVFCFVFFTFPAIFFRVVWMQVA